MLEYRRGRTHLSVRSCVTFGAQVEMRTWWLGLMLNFCLSFFIFHSRFHVQAFCFKPGTGESKAQTRAVEVEYESGNAHRL